MMKNVQYWKGTNHENDEVSMEEMVTNPMLDLQEMIIEFRKISRQTYLTVSKQAERRSLKSLKTNHFHSDHT